MTLFDGFVMTSLNTLVTVFVFLVGIAVLVIGAMYVTDVSQTADAVRRNYPVIGRFRDFFSTLGEFFRQYFFAMDREEMPFNRAERDWVYRSSAGGDNTVAFGSTRNLSPVGTAIFVNCAYPQLDEETREAPPLTIGPHARQPYTTRLDHQHFGHELWRAVAAGRPSTVARRQNGRVLAQHRRGRALSVPS